ncbi:MAG: hypothetical protein IJS28_04525 [Synergistaceae bacterium]|nr:hypothetical protein [Synergistaceae bacterium]
MSVLQAFQHGKIFLTDDSIIVVPPDNFLSLFGEVSQFFRSEAADFADFLGVDFRIRRRQREMSCIPHNVGSTAGEDYWLAGIQVIIKKFARIPLALATGRKRAA